MDSYEATKIVFSRIQALDPENASKITGYVLIQEHGEKEMIRLAFGPESLLRALIFKAKLHLGIPSSSSYSSSSSSTLTPPITPPSVAPFSRPFPAPLRVNSFSNLSPSSTSSPWQLPLFSSPPSYAAAVLKGGSNGSTISSSSTSSSSSSTLGSSVGGVLDEYGVQEQLSFLTDTTTTTTSSSTTTTSCKKIDSFITASSDIASTGGAQSYGVAWEEAMAGGGQLAPHRRSLSLSDACFGSEEVGAGLGWRPCLYFARGFCKNGSSCKFVHGSSSSSSYGEAMDSPTSVVGSPGKMEVFEQCQELLRSKAIAQQQQQQRLAAAIAGASFPYNKCMNLLMNDAQRFMMSEELQQQQQQHKFGRWRAGERGDFCGIGGVNPGSRQIYLTFPADSTFREEDVSNYFSIYGLVQDVRIPYQQKRMFGFVTFVYPETVKLILAKGNPHFVCDSRVLVKPYKEKGKVPDKNKLLHQQRGDYPTCPSPTAVDSREAYDLHQGRYYGELLLRKKLEEQADLQHAIDLQGRRLLNLQLLDLKNNHAMFMGGGGGGIGMGRGVSFPFPSPPTHHSFTHPHAVEENGIEASSCALATHNLEESHGFSFSNMEEGGGIHESSLAHVLPDNLFSSPKKSNSETSNSPFSSNPVIPDSDENPTQPRVATSDPPTNPPPPFLTPNKSCSFHLPRISSGQGAIEM